MKDGKKLTIINDHYLNIGSNFRVPQVTPKLYTHSLKGSRCYENIVVSLVKKVFSMLVTFIILLSDCNGIRIYNHLVRKSTLNDLAKTA